MKYPDQFKQEVVIEYEAGASITDLMRKHKITGKNTIQKWVMKYGKIGLRDRGGQLVRSVKSEQIKNLEKRIQQMESQIQKLQLHNLMLETLIEVLEEAKLAGELEPLKNSGKKKSKSRK